MMKEEIIVIPQVDVLSVATGPQHKIHRENDLVLLQHSGDEEWLPLSDSHDSTELPPEISAADSSTNSPATARGSLVVSVPVRTIDAATLIASPHQTVSRLPSILTTGSSPPLTNHKPAVDGSAFKSHETRNGSITVLDGGTPYVSLVKKVNLINDQSAIDQWQAMEDKRREERKKQKDEHTKMINAHVAAKSSAVTAERGKALSNVNGGLSLTGRKSLVTSSTESRQQTHSFSDVTSDGHPQSEGVSNITVGDLFEDSSSNIKVVFQTKSSIGKPLLPNAHRSTLPSPGHCRIAVAPTRQQHATMIEGKSVNQATVRATTAAGTPIVSNQSNSSESSVNGDAMSTTVPVATSTTLILSPDKGKRSTSSPRHRLTATRLQSVTQAKSSHHAQNHTTPQSLASTQSSPISVRTTDSPVLDAGSTVSQPASPTLLRSLRRSDDIDCELPVLHPLAPEASHEHVSLNKIVTEVYNVSSTSSSSAHTPRKAVVDPQESTTKLTLDDALLQYCLGNVQTLHCSLENYQSRPGFVQDSSGAFGGASGTRLGNYFKIMDMLGQGVFAVILRCLPLQPCHNFPVDELDRVDDDSDALGHTQPLRTLGMRTVAIKIMHNNFLLQQQTDREISILTDLSRAAVAIGESGDGPQNYNEYQSFAKFVSLPLMFLHLTEGFRGVVMPIYTQNLFQFMRDDDFRPVPLPLCARIARQLFSALVFLHSHDIVHRGLKPENVMLRLKGNRSLRERRKLFQLKQQQAREQRYAQFFQKAPGSTVESQVVDCENAVNLQTNSQAEGEFDFESSEELDVLDLLHELQVVVVDFDSALKVDADSRLVAHSSGDAKNLFYAAPELLVGHDYGVEIDVWSAGAIVAEMVCGETVFMGEDNVDQLAAIAEALGPIPECWQTVKEASVSEESIAADLIDPVYSTDVNVHTKPAVAQGLSVVIHSPDTQHLENAHENHKHPHSSKTTSHQNHQKKSPRSSKVSPRRRINVHTIDENPSEQSPHKPEISYDDDHDTPSSVEPAEAPLANPYEWVKTFCLPRLCSKQIVSLVRESSGRRSVMVTRSLSTDHAKMTGIGAAAVNKLSPTGNAEDSVQGVSLTRNSFMSAQCGTIREYNRKSLRGLVMTVLVGRRTGLLRGSHSFSVSHDHYSHTGPSIIVNDSTTAAGDTTTVNAEVGSQSTRTSHKTSLRPTLSQGASLDSNDPSSSPTALGELAVDFLESCLQYIPHMRMSTRASRSHSSPSVDLTPADHSRFALDHPFLLTSQDHTASIPVFD